MTLPSESCNSVRETRKFLRSLLAPPLTPGVPKRVREEASRLLKHYPYAETDKELLYVLKHKVGA